MNKISELFSKKKCFIGYLTVGDGGLDYSLQSALALIKGGVDILELGIPFSDPVADGPVIQAAMQRSLQQGTKFLDVLELAEQLKKYTDTPLVLFSYYNPLLMMGNTIYERIKQNGIEGMLIVDLPFEEAKQHLMMCKKNNIDPILLLTPTSSVLRIKTMSNTGGGFLYYVCRKGTTGVRDDLPVDYADKMSLIKKNTTLPTVAGFGISNAAMAKKALHYADGFVVGSLFVKAMEKRVSAKELTALAKEIDPR